MINIENQRHRLVIILCVMGLLASHVSLAQAVLQPEQVLDRHEYGELDWSVDSKRLVVVVTEPVSSEGQESHIWMYDVEQDEFRQLTFGRKTNSQPEWSPDGRSLAFLSSGVDDKTQIYILPISGGEARPVTDDGSGVIAYEWSPDSQSIAFLSADPAPEPDDESSEDKDGIFVASEAVRPTHLRLVDVESGDITTASKGRWRVSALSWYPNGSNLIISATDNFSAELLTDRLFSIEIDGGEMTLIAEPDGPISNLSVSPDGRFLVYIGSTEGGPVPHSLFLQPLNGGGAVDLTGDTLDRMIVDFTWVNPSEIVALAVDGFSDQLVRVSVEGSIGELRSFSGQTVDAFAIVGDEYAYVAGSGNAPQEVHLWGSRGDEQISHLNENFPALIAPRLFHYRAMDETEIEAAFFEPQGWDRPETGWKTVLLIHGGPSGRWSHEISDWAQLLVDRGFAVLAPNIRGSVGYGLDFIRSNRYDWGGADFKDAIAGVDHLIERAVVDAERVAIAGWSYGGYMSAWAITQTDRFKAAIVGAAMTDLAAEYGTEAAEINAYDTWFLGSPYENLDDFVKMSPMTHVRNARTPALIMVGEKDRIDPVGQSQQFYRALRRYGVESELIIYPREPHTIGERAHRIDSLERVVGWIATYNQ